MKPLLYNYYIDYTKREKTRLIILCLLHELRVISIQQMQTFLQIDDIAAESTTYENLRILKKGAYSTLKKWHNDILLSYKGRSQLHWRLLHVTQSS